MERINWVTGACFQAIGSLGVDPQEAAQSAHDRLRAALEAVVRRAREASFDEADARLIVYALAALADEVAMSAGGPLRAHWATAPLQLLHFRENVAGERFFVNLAHLRDASPSTDVLRTYYLCLLFGFRGQYGVRGDDAGLRALVADVGRELMAQLEVPDRLMPRAAADVPTPEPPSGKRSVRIGLFAMLATMALYLGLSAKLTEARTQLAAVAEREDAP